MHPDADQGKASGSGHGGDADPGASTTTASSAASLRRTRGHAPPVPDFKALHALQASVLAQQRERRAEVHPTVPVAFGLATETRAAERERFEEARRAREREALQVRGPMVGVVTSGTLAVRAGGEEMVLGEGGVVYVVHDGAGRREVEVQVMEAGEGGEGERADIDYLS